MTSTPSLAGKKIAMLHYAYPSKKNVGGVEAVMKMHATYLVENHGATVHILTGSGTSTIAGVNITRCRLYASGGPLITPIRESLAQGVIPPNFRAVVNRIKRQLVMNLAGVDVLIVHQIMSMLFNMALTVALYELIRDGELKCKVISWCHDFAWRNDPKNPYLAELNGREGSPWDLLQTRWSENIPYVVVSDESAQIFESLFASYDSPRVIYNGGDLNTLMNLHPWTLAFFKRTGVAEGGPFLLTPARVVVRKNLLLAIWIVWALRRLGRNATLVISAALDPHNPKDAALFTELKELRAKLGLQNVVFFLSEEMPGDDGMPGVPEDDIVADIWRVCDALLLPSWQEGFGIPGVEARLLTKLMITSCLEPLMQIARSGISEKLTALFSFFFDPGEDPERIASHINAWLDDSAYGWYHEARIHMSWEGIVRDKLVSLILEQLVN